MAETSEQAAPEVAAPAPEPARRRLWPLIAGALIAAVIAVTGVVHALGGRAALIVAGCLAAAGAALLVLWRLPHLRRHFARPRGASRMARSMRRMAGGKGPGPSSGGRRGKFLGGAAGKGKGLLSGKGRAGAAKSLLGKGRGGGKAAAGRTGIGGKRLLGGAAGKGRALKGLAGRARGRTTGSGRRAGKLFPSLPGGKGRAARKAAGTSGRRATPGAGLGGLWKRARAITGGKRARAGEKPSRMRVAAGLAAAVPLLPLIAAKRLWGRLRKQRGGTPEAPAAAPGQDAAEPAAEPERQPGLALSPDTAHNPGREKRDVSSQVEAAAEAISEGLGSFEPENVGDLGRFFEALPEVYEALGSALTRLADRFGDELPVHGDVAEHIRELAAQSAGLHEYAAETHGIFRAAHAEDLERLENPRPGEPFMDFSNQ